MTRPRGTTRPEEYVNDMWIGVDFDGTLATMSHEEPVPAMVERVKNWLAEGKDVRILTSRVSVLIDRDREYSQRQADHIAEWCETHIGRRLPVTSQKDYEMWEMWDDNCHRVKRNTGEVLA